MQAGREMDALVAEKVMGLLPCSDPIGRCDGAKMKPCQCWGTPDRMGVVAGGDLQPYSTSIESAWPVVEKMSCPILEANGGQWQCFCLGLKSNPLHEPIMAEADTAPLAICKAALAACGVKVEVA